MLSTDSNPQPALRRVVEHLTLVTLLLAVSLYAIGQFQSWKYIEAFGIPPMGLERGWETYTFMGAVSLLNLIMNLGAASLRWLLPLGLLVGAWALWRRLPAGGEGLAHRLRRTLTTLGLGATYILFLLMVGVSWGLESARLLKESPTPGDRYGLTPEAQALMPAGFQEANAKGALRFVVTGTDSIFVYDRDLKQTYAVPNRLIVCRVYTTRR